MRADKTETALDLRAAQLALPFGDRLVYLPLRRRGVFHGRNGGVGEREIFRAAGKVALHASRGLGEPSCKRRAVTDDLRRAHTHPVREYVQRIEKRGLFPPIAQNARFILLQAPVFGDERAVAGAELRDGGIDHPPPERRRAADHGEIVRGKEDRFQALFRFPRRELHAVALHRARPAAAEQYLHALFALGCEILPAHRRLVLFKGDEFLIVICAEALGAGEHVYRFQKRRFPLRVRARDDVYARRKFAPAALQQTEIFRLHRIDAHQPSARRRTGRIM